MKNNQIILKDGSKVNVYQSSQRDTLINSNDCKTEYKQIVGTNKYEVVK